MEVIIQKSKFVFLLCNFKTSCVIDYLIGKSYLPESITVADLDNKKPLDELVWDVSSLVNTKILKEYFSNLILFH